MKKAINRLGLLMIISVCTILTVIYIQPYIYSNFQSEFGRHKVILDLLNNESKTDNIIIFGDSRAMFGINSKIVEKNSGFKGNVYNLSSVAQSPYEAGYYYSKIKNNTKMVIQCVSPAFFIKDITTNLSEEKAISMFLSGYRIDENNIYNENCRTFFNNSDIENYFKSRTYYTSYFNTFIRKLVDNEKFNENSFNSVYFPNPAITKKHPNYPFFKYDCKKYHTIDKPLSQIAFFIHSKKYFDRMGVDYVLLFLPVNPDECNESYKEFNIIARNIKQLTNLRVIDLSGLLKNSIFFYDGLHCNKDGAKIISQEISNKLR